MAKSFRSRVLLPAVLVGFAVAAAACSSSSKSSTTSTGPTTTTAAIPPTAAGIPMCTVKDLTITTQDPQGAAGTISVVFAMKNTSGKQCELNGYPGIAAQYQDGKEAPTTAERGGGISMKNWPGPSRVVIPSGGSGYFVMEYSDVPTGNGTCAQFPRTAVTPPNNATSASVAYGMSPCTVNGNYIVKVSAVSGTTH